MILRAMHIPDGFLDARTALAAAGLALAGLAVALPRVERCLPPQRTPLLGLGGAFVFAAQMLNFPIGGGTSGHLIGSVLITALLGPAAAVVVLTAVLLVQCLLFADGGILALGANVLNMAIVAPLCGWLPLRWAQRGLGGRRGLLVGAFLGGFCGVVGASLVCAMQLALAGAVAWELALPAMGGVHALIGIGEGAITALVLGALQRVRPDLLVPWSANTIDDAPALERGRAGLRTWALVAIGLLLALAPFASELPDGLEYVAARLGFAGQAIAAATAPMPDYEAPFVTTPALATIVAGVVGALGVLALLWLLLRVRPLRWKERG